MSRAVVIGASIGGLLVARALADHVDEVIAIDRDTPPAEPGIRRGASQGGAAHLLLDSGRQAMERLLPGLFDELRAAGGNQADMGEVCCYQSGHYKIRAQTGLSVAVQSRPFLEHHVRQRVSALEGVQLRYGLVCRGLVASGGRIRGVRVSESGRASESGVRSSESGVMSSESGVRSHDSDVLSSEISGSEDAVEELLEADIVVIACGCGSQAVRWTEELGVPAPPTQTVNIGLGYASRLYENMPEVPNERPAIITYGVRPRAKVHGLAFGVEHGRVLVSGMGYHGEYPGREAESFEAWFNQLETQDIARNLAQATPVGEVHSFRIPKQFRRHWQRVSLPEGLAVVGDAACGLDPIFGQGMSVVALQAAALQEMLARGPFKTRKVQKMVARKTDRPWLITAIEAARYGESAPDVRVPLVRFVQRFLDRVYAVSTHDRVVYRAFLDVIFLNRDATWLFRPSILARLLRPLPRDGEEPAQSSLPVSGAS